MKEPSLEKTLWAFALLAEVVDVDVGAASDFELGAEVEAGDAELELVEDLDAIGGVREGEGEVDSEGRAVAEDGSSLSNLHQD